MRPKLTDVAKKAGVSPTTVSRVINNYGYLSEKTKKQGLPGNSGTKLPPKFLGPFASRKANQFDRSNRS